jgi:hypothetical protein
LRRLVTLLLAVLIGFSPIAASTASGADHCAPEVVAGADQHSHGHDGHRQSGDTHTDCPHCPPAECGTRSHCPQPVQSLAAVEVACHRISATVDHGSAALPEIVPTRSERPPLRPPMEFLR